MAEGAPEQGGENLQEQMQALVQELGPLIQKLQSIEDPKEKLNIIKRILEILAKLKEMFASAGQEEAYFEQFGQLEMQMQQALGQMEG